MTFAHPLPWWGLAGVLLAAALIAWLAYRRAAAAPSARAALAGLRFCTLALVVLLLMRPVARVAPDEAGGAAVPILVDTSRSMSIEDAAGERRVDRAREIVTGTLLPALSPRFGVEVFGFAEEVTPAQPDQLAATGRRSDLAGALRAIEERYRGRPLAGIVLLSDGGDTSGEVGSGQFDPQIPVYAIGIGSRSIDRDREVLSATVAESVLDDSRLDLAVSAVSHGEGGAAFELRLLENGRPVEIRRVQPAGDGVPVREVFQIEPRTGTPGLYTVEVPTGGADPVPENNARSVLVQQPSRPRRVLLVQGAPGYEHSFLRRAWRSDPGLEIDSVIRQGRNEQGSDTFYIQAAAGRSAGLSAGYPLRREELFAYDAIVLANVDASMLSRAQLDATREFVSTRGGGLLVLGARSFLRQGLVDSPLEDVLPLDPADRSRGVVQASAASRGAYRISLTPAGEAHPVMQLARGIEESRRRWDALPALASVAPLGGPRAGASVLAETSGPAGSTRPLVAVHRFGEGRAMVFTGEAAWRWRMLLPAEDRTYDVFWRQAVRWLALAAPDPVAVVVPAASAPGDLVRLRVAARTAAFEPRTRAAVEVRVSGPAGDLARIPAVPNQDGASPGVFVAHFRPPAAGVYRVAADVEDGEGRAEAAATSMLVGGADPEMTDPRLNSEVLQRLAGSSGGRVIDPGEVAALAGRLQASVPAATILVRRDLWHNAWSFALLVALLSAEWVLRRRWGMR